MRAEPYGSIQFFIGTDQFVSVRQWTGFSNLGWYHHNVTIILNLVMYWDFVGMFNNEAKFIEAEDHLKVLILDSYELFFISIK